MRKEISDIFELKNSAILTPYNLLDNIHLDNFKEINFFKEDMRIICIMISYDGNDKFSYKYEFDMNNHLLVAHASDNDSNTYELFNREKELSKKYERVSSSYFKKIV